MNSKLRIVLAATICLATSELSHAEDYPTRSITMIVPSPAGGGADYIARLIGNALSKSIGQTVVVQNVGGANGNIGTGEVARAAPDGYTLLLTNSGNHVTNPALYPSLRWDPERDFAPVAMVFSAPFVLVSNTKAPFTSLTEMVAYAKDHPGRLNYASPGIGSGNHIGVEHLSQLTGISMTHVPYRGAAPAVTDLVSGSVDLFSSTPQAVIPILGNANIRGLAISSKSRHPLLPNVPTAAEAGVPEWLEEAWYAVYAPANTPQPVVEKLAASIAGIVASADFQTRAVQSGGTAIFQGPAQLAISTQRDRKFWSALIQRLNLRLE